MIDLHCHYLPFVDDGAATLDEAVALATAAVANGIRHAVLTPHVYPGQWDNTATSLRAPFAAFHRMIETSGLPLGLSLGGEVRLLPECLEMAARGELPTLGGWDDDRVVLLEFPDSHVPAGADKATDFLRARGYRPMIAHPERNKDVMRDPRKLLPFLQQGCLVQLTAASVAGLFGAPALKSALQLLDAGVVTVIASDAHNLAHRPPRMAEARRAIVQRYGEAAAVLLTETNPGRVVGLVSPLPVQVPVPA